MQELVYDLQRIGIATELLTGDGADGMVHYGVRLRTFGKNLPKNKMVMAEGATFEEAMDIAYGEAIARRWINTDWAARPWPVASRRQDLSDFFS